MSHGSFLLVVGVVAVDPYMGKITNNFSGANFFLSFFLCAPATRKKALRKKPPQGCGSNSNSTIKFCGGGG